MEDAEVFKRRLARERAARLEAERIAEEKTRALYDANLHLETLNDRLQGMVDERTAELLEARDLAVAANRAKSAFLANMSHELRTPLNAIIGYSEMIMEERPAGDPALISDVQRILTAGKHLLSLINDVLDLSKIEAGKMTTFSEEVSVSDLATGVIETVRPLATKNRNELRLELGDALGTVVTDAVKLRQILFNLLSNAMKFTDHGRVSLRVVREERRVLFEVTDSGVGIAPEHLDRLFLPFTQVDSSTTRRAGGTGLGLALSQKFCEMLGGEITAVSAPGSGSVFRFSLPTDTKPSEGAAEQGFETGDGRRAVLVVDDDETVHDLITRHFAATDFRVVCTADPTRAVALAREVRPTVITLDVLMPRKDGWSVLTDLKQDPETSHIPVVLLSIMDERGFGFALGAADYLVKPVPRAKLLGALRKHADKARGNQVLVVEDEHVLRSLMSRALTSDGWAVVEAENGRQALDLVAEQLPAVIVLDLMMPEVDGFQFLAELQHIEGARDIPVVVVTAKDLTEEDLAFFRTKAKVVLNKCASDGDRLLGELKRCVERNSRPD